MTDTTLDRIAALDAALAPLLAEREALQRAYLLAHGWRQVYPNTDWYINMNVRLNCARC